MKAVALVPSYEPDGHLVEVVRGLRALGFDAVVVDDGSGASYQGVFDEAAKVATVIGYLDNCGKGCALKVGLDYVRRHYPSDAVVVTVDGDGQHALADVERCAEQAEAHPQALVLGSRDFGSHRVPLRSRVGNLVTRAVFRATAGRAISDTQTGLRAFRASMIDFFLGVSGERYEYEMNVLYACSESDVQLVEVPIQTIYEDGNAGSHFHAVRDSLIIYRGILTFACSSFVSFLADYALFALLLAAFSGLGANGVIVANVLARLASATLNYNLNRVYVFHSNESVGHTALRYAALAATILAANTCVLELLVNVAGLPALASKLVVEVTLFFVNWVVQNRAVFAGKDR